MYDASLGRFLSTDPKGFVDGYNLYAYVKNNPLKYVDPMGTTAKSSNSSYDSSMPESVFNQNTSSSSSSSSKPLEGTVFEDWQNSPEYANHSGSGNSYTDTTAETSTSSPSDDNSSTTVVETVTKPATPSTESITGENQNTAEIRNPEPNWWRDSVYGQIISSFGDPLAKFNDGVNPINGVLLTPRESQDALVSTVLGGFIPAARGAKLGETAFNTLERKIDAIIDETWSGIGKIKSDYTVNTDEALALVLKYLGNGYKEIGKKGDGVFRSIDNKRQIRIDQGSLEGNHKPKPGHIHLEVVNDDGRGSKTNNHIILKDD